MVQLPGRWFSYQAGGSVTGLFSGGTSSQEVLGNQTRSLPLRSGLKRFFLIKLMVRAGSGHNEPSFSSAAAGLDCWEISHDALGSLLGPLALKFI